MNHNMVQNFHFLTIINIRIYNYYYKNIKKQLEMDNKTLKCIKSTKEINTVNKRPLKLINKVEIVILPLI